MHSDQAKRQSNGDSGAQESSALARPPSISLPKGGGAIRGMGEKFGANPVTGTGSMTVPIATSPSRSGFGPQLTLSHDSGSGNGPFGLGRSLLLIAITRKTGKGRPRYEHTDARRLHPLGQRRPGAGARTQQRWRLGPPTPKIEHWTAWTTLSPATVLESKASSSGSSAGRASATATFSGVRSLRTASPPWYGKTAESRIADPADTSRVFS